MRGRNPEDLNLGRERATGVPPRQCSVRSLASARRLFSDDTCSAPRLEPAIDNVRKCVMTSGVRISAAWAARSWFRDCTGIATGRRRTVGSSTTNPRQSRKVRPVPRTAASPTCSRPDASSAASPEPAEFAGLGTPAATGHSPTSAVSSQPWR
jgi:hypothetical protein